MITRSQLAQKYGFSLYKVRSLLKALNIEPTKVKLTQRGRPIFYYQQNITDTIDGYLKELDQYKKSRMKKCCICKKKFPELDMIGSRCMDCYIKKVCVPILYGKEFWKKTVKSPLVKRALQYLSKFTRPTRSS